MVRASICLLIACFVIGCEEEESGDDRLICDGQGVAGDIDMLRAESAIMLQAAFDLDFAPQDLSVYFLEVVGGTDGCPATDHSTVMMMASNTLLEQVDSYPTIEWQYDCCASAANACEGRWHHQSIF